ncbi:hypothetical protein [Teredinibacter purpureus]|uniref:hypothetical protein n=1 Tax=Teredinibacter purpureus TaxID=2731756 RepID=UPI0005F7676A|nr:hypothetical protein [Teredinibacter purpureus]
MKWKILNKVSAIFLLILLLAVIADLFVFATVEYGRKGIEFVGCYAYDAMLIGFECQGFSGSSIVASWLNWPLWLVFAPMFAIFSIKAFVVAILVWLPLVAYIISVFKINRHK